MKFSKLTLIILFYFFVVNLTAQKIFWSENGARIKSLDISNDFITELISINGTPDDQFSSLTTNSDSNTVYYSLIEGVNDELGKIRYDGTDAITLLENISAVDMVYHPVEEKIYFISGLGGLGGNSIDVLSIEDNSVETIYDLGSNMSLKGLDLDLVEEKIYFTQDGSGIWRIDFDGETLEQIYSAQLLPKISTLPLSQKIFWLEFNSIGFFDIKSSNLQGGDIETIIEVGFFDGYFIYDFTIDEINQKLYFLGIDASSGSNQYFMRRSNLDGTNIEDVLEHEDFDGQPWAISIDDGFTNQDELIVNHYHQLPNHPSFSTPTFLSSYISNNSEFQEFKVCTDGSDASIFEISYVLGNQIEQGEFILRIQEDPNGNNPEIYGSFSSLPPSNNNVITISYNHPEYIESETNGDYINIELVEVATGDVKETIPLALYNPPVLLIHGLASNGEAFKTLQEYLQSKFYYPEELTFSVDYKSTNDEEYFINEPVIPKHTDGIIKEAIIHHYSVGEVDIVAHSMGGILSRIYLQSNYYLNEINRLITVNTPHSGTQLPNYILDPNSNATIPQLACAALLLLNSNASCFDGAVEDLRVNSNAILNDLNGSNLNFNIVPSHAIVTTYNQSPAEVIGIKLLLGTTLALGAFVYKYIIF